jgi:hypothetical protein
LWFGNEKEGRVDWSLRRAVTVVGVFVVIIDLRGGIASIDSLVREWRM